MDPVAPEAATSTPLLPGFAHVKVLGFSEILRSFSQAIPQSEWGYALDLSGRILRWQTRTALVSESQGNTYEPVRFLTTSGPALQDVVALCGGGDYSLALLADGTVWGWGEDFHESMGQVPVDVDDPARVVDLAGITELVARPNSSAHFAIQRDGALWAWGYNGGGSLGIGASGRDVRRPVRVPLDGPVAAVRDTTYHGRYALLRDGSVLAWGSRDPYDAAPENRTLPARVEGLPPIGALGDEGVVISVAGDVWTWDEELQASKIDGVADAVSVICDFDDHWKLTYHALTSSGTVLGWGSNSSGQIGDGSTDDSSTAVPLAALSNVTALASNRSVRYALTHEGTLLTWGGVGYGDGYAATPVRVDLPGIREPEFERWYSHRPTALGSDEFRGEYLDLRGGRTILMICSAAGLVDEVQTMLRQGADLDEVDVDGDTALFYATSRGRAEVVETLLRGGADPNVAAGHSGATPLYFAAVMASGLQQTPPDTSTATFTVIMATLLRHGANPAQMYDHNLALARHTPSGLQVIRREHVANYLSAIDELTVMYLNPTGGFRP